MRAFGKLFKPDIADLKEKRDISGLIQSLSYREWTIRRDAAVALGELAAEVAWLLEGLQSLRKFLPSVVVPKLAAYLHKADFDPIESSIESEQMVAGSVLMAFPPLTAALKDQKSEVSKAATQAIAYIEIVMYILEKHMAEEIN
jgi:HEAT repeat protein